MDSPWRIKNYRSIKKQTKYNFNRTKEGKGKDSNKNWHLLFLYFDEKTSGASTEDGNEGLPLVDLELVGPKV